MSRRVDGSMLLTRASAIATGTAIGLAIGTAILRADVAGVVGGIASSVLIVAAIFALAPAEHRWRLSAIALLALALRLAVASTLFSASLAVGEAGYVTGDDHGYGALILGLASWWHGVPQPPFVPPSWYGTAYLFSAWVFFAAAIVYL